MTVIIDYDAGNLRSVQRACAEVGLTARITNDAKSVAHADRVIFPGVGAAGSAMKSIKASGLDVALRHALDAGTPVLGICLGLQISLDHSEEGDTPTLGLIEGRVVRFRLDDPSLKIPHMGWNEVTVVKPHPLLRKVSPGDEFYFVHGYYPDPNRTQRCTPPPTTSAPLLCVGARKLLRHAVSPGKERPRRPRAVERFAAWDGRPC